jgi:hypothetical protein
MENGERRKTTINAEHAERRVRKLTAATAVLAGRRPEGLHYSCYDRPAKAGRYACYAC